MSFVHLQGHRFMLLTTFRKNGTPMPTPVWFAQEGETLYVMTNAKAGKVKRIRNNAQVEVAPCSADGTVRGETQEAMARILPHESQTRAIRALNRKYGWQKRLFDVGAWVSRAQRVYLEIAPME